jgi:arylsulfatase A-like enzyme
MRQAEPLQNTRPRSPWRKQHGRAVLFLAAAVVVLAGTTAWWLLRGNPAVLSQGRPATPVIIYLIDTLRADRLGLYGYRTRETSPAIDALAAESVVFEQAYSAAPWTLPSVASLITSTYSCEHNVTRDTNRLSPALQTLAQRLSGLGYATGSYYGNGYAGDMADLDRGYQIAELRRDSNERADDVRGFLDRSAGAPFFLYLHTMEPHQPFNVASRYISRFGHAPMDERENYRAAWHLYRELRAVDWAARRPIGSTDNTPAQEAAMSYLASLRPTVDLVYDAAVSSADDHLRQVIEVLKAKGAWDQALFILLADHGEEFGEHQGWTHGQSVYEEMVRVPLLVHFPRGEHGGRRVGTPVSLVDVMPSIFEYIGQPHLCDGCRGRSFLPLVRAATRAGGIDAPPSLRINQQHYFRPWKEQRGDINVVVREAGWKAIWNAEKDAVELYDIEQDRGETTDLAAQRPGIARRLGNRARAWFEACRADAKAPIDRELDHRVKESLRALGYFN